MKEICKAIIIEIFIGIFAVMGFILTIIFGLLLYCYAI